MEHLMLKLEKTLMLGKIEGKRRRGDRGWDGWMVSTNSMKKSLSKLRELVMGKDEGMLQSMVSQKARHDWATEQQEQYEHYNHSQMSFYLIKVCIKKGAISRVSWG